MVTPFWDPKNVYKDFCATIAFYLTHCRNTFAVGKYADISKGLRLHHKVKQKIRGALNASELRRHPEYFKKEIVKLADNVYQEA